jgi:hypothetical protein
MRRGTAIVKHPTEDRHHTVEVVHIETPQDLADLAADADWHGGKMSVLRIKGVPTQGCIAPKPPRGAGGIRFMPGAYITKDEEGRFSFLRNEAAFVPQEETA